jgi:hypothetical protein
LRKKSAFKENADLDTAYLPELSFQKIGTVAQPSQRGGKEQERISNSCSFFARFPHLGRRAFEIFNQPGPTSLRSEIVLI